MTYRITIKEVPKEPKPKDNTIGIASMFQQKSGYSDTPAYVDSKSPYATNVDSDVKIEIPEPFRSIGIPFSDGIAQFKISDVGKDGKVEFTTDSYKEAFFYKTLSKQMKHQGIDIHVVEVSGDPNIASVVDEDQLIKAFKNQNINDIRLFDSFSTRSRYVAYNHMVFDGNDNKIETEVNATLFTFTKGGHIHNLELVNLNYSKKWDSIFGIQVDEVQTYVENVKIHGFNAAMYVNGCNCTLSGTIDVTDNIFGGIEVTRSPYEYNPSVLNINGATLINKSERYGKPTIWINGTTNAQGVVTGAENMTMIELNGQLQYYIDANNAVAPLR